VYTNSSFLTKMVYVSGMFIYPAVHLSGGHCISFLEYVHPYDVSLVADNKIRMNELQLVSTGFYYWK